MDKIPESFSKTKSKAKICTLKMGIMQMDSRSIQKVLKDISLNKLTRFKDMTDFSGEDITSSFVDTKISFKDTNY